MKRNTRTTFFVGVIVLAPFVLSTPLWAMLDIFDHPQAAEKGNRGNDTAEQFKLLCYPKERFLKGDYNETFLSCKKILDRQLNKRVKGEVLCLAGLSCLKMGRFIEARPYFNDVIFLRDQDPEFAAQAHIGIADSYFLEGSFDRAFDAYNEFLARYPGSPFLSTVYYRMGEISYKRNRPEEALKFLDKTISDYPMSFEARLAQNLANENTSCRLPPAGNDSFYSVQVGCYNKKENAADTYNKLVKHGFDAYIWEAPKGEKPKFRVKVGKLNSVGPAQDLEKRLQASGYSTKICP